MKHHGPLLLAAVVSFAIAASASAIQTTLNVPYAVRQGFDPNQTKLDIYAPDSASSSGPLRPVMIYLHGGAWNSGDKAAVAVKDDYFVTVKEWVFVSVNYRLTSATVTFPMHAIDVAEAVAWLRQNIAQYGGDPAQLHIMGHSAGAHLAACAPRPFPARATWSMRVALRRA